MGILYVNPSRRGKKRVRVSGRAKVARHGSKRSKKRKMPRALAAYWKKRRGKSKARRSSSKKRRGGATKRKSAMAKKKRRRARRGKVRSKRKSRRRGRKRARGGKRRKARRARKSSRKRSRKRSSKRRSRKRSRKRSSKRRSRKRSRRKTTRRRRRKSVHSAKTVRMKTGPHGTLIMNPRRRRRKARRARRRGHRRARRAVRRYGRSHYRKNPGGMLIDLAKRAAPVLIGLYGARLLVGKIGPRIPGVSRLGSFQSPLLAVGAVLAVNFATKKIGKLAKYRSELLLGTGLNALDAIISAFAPASVKAAIGVGDVYDRALGEYMRAGSGSDVMNPSAAMGEYVQMGEYVSVGDVDEELGGMGDVYEELGVVEQELGVVEQELGMGDSLGQGVSRGAMLRPVQRQSFLEPVPTRSFVGAIDPATEVWNDPLEFYQGIFAGGADGVTWNPKG